MWVLGKTFNNITIPSSGTLVGSDTNKADFCECLSYLTKTGYPSDKIHLIKGWFQNTLLINRDKIGKIAILRLDGDFYESTKVVFEALYDQVVPGGAVIIDDYGSFEGCRIATHEMFAANGINPHLVYVDNGIRYFIKP